MEFVGPSHKPPKISVADTDPVPRRLRILGILNGSMVGYSGGDFHTTAILSELAGAHAVELYLPRGSSSELIELLDHRIKARRSLAEQRFSTKLREWIVRSRIRYSVLAAMRML